MRPSGSKENLAGTPSSRAPRASGAGTLDYRGGRKAAGAEWSGVRKSETNLGIARANSEREQLSSGKRRN